MFRVRVSSISTVKCISVPPVGIVPGDVWRRRTTPLARGIQHQAQPFLDVIASQIGIVFPKQAQAVVFGFYREQGCLARLLDKRAQGRPDVLAVRQTLLIKNSDTPDARSNGKRPLRIPVDESVQL